MDDMRCPSCGEPYNGKKCRACLYEPMKTDIAGSRNTPERKAAVPRKKHPKSVSRSLLGFMIILMLICIVTPALRNWGIKLDAIEAANRAPEPIPGNPTVLFHHDTITVLVPETDSADVSLWFYNRGKEDAVVVCRDITVNGYRMENILLSVYVSAGTAVKGTLLELEVPADTFSFSMEAHKPNGEFLFETAPIQLDRE